MRTQVRHRVTLLGVCALLVTAAGCATTAADSPPSPALATRPARVDVVNLSDYDWRIVFTSADGHEAAASRVPAGGVMHFDVPGGAYTIAQTALAGLTGPDATRRFPAHLAAGASYRWRLATLLTGQTGAMP